MKCDIIYTHGRGLPWSAIGPDGRRIVDAGSWRAMQEWLKANSYKVGRIWQNGSK